MHCYALAEQFRFNVNDGFAEYELDIFPGVSHELAHFPLQEGFSTARETVMESDRVKLILDEDMRIDLRQQVEAMAQ